MDSIDLPSRGKDGRTKVCLFAKAPAIGRVKTRMAARLSDGDCLQLHKDLLVYMTKAVSALPRQHYLPELTMTEADPFFDQLSEHYGLPARLQIGRDLGARMSRAVVDGLRDHAAVLLIGADCPFVDSATIAAMSTALTDCDAVMVPALDGGYAAFMLCKHDASLFNGIVWGTDRVADTTEGRMQALQWDYRILPAIPDIDRPDDLQYLSRLPDLRHWAAK